MMLHHDFDVISNIKAILPAIMGALVSSMSVPQSVAGVSGLLSASIIGFVGGNALVEYLAISDTTWVAFFLKFSIGVFGLAILRESLIKMPDLISSLSKRFTGG
jgi:hypothetical protein